MIGAQPFKGGKEGRGRRHRRAAFTSSRTARRPRRPSSRSRRRRERLSAMGSRARQRRRARARRKIGVFLTLTPADAGRWSTEAAAAGQFARSRASRRCRGIQIVTIEEAHGACATARCSSPPAATTPSSGRRARRTAGGRGGWSYRLAPRRVGPDQPPIARPGAARRSPATPSRKRVDPRARPRRRSPAAP